jgi:hypothetical protein
MVVVQGGWIINVLIVLGMLVLLAGMGRTLWRMAKSADSDRHHRGDRNRP